MRQLCLPASSALSRGLNKARIMSIPSHLIPYLIFFIAIALGGFLVAQGMRAHRKNRKTAENGQGKPHPVELLSWVFTIIGTLISTLLVVFNFAPGGGAESQEAHPTSSSSKAVTEQARQGSSSESPGESATPTAPTTPEESSQGIVEENSGIPLTIRTAHDGTSCDPYIAIDFDGSPSGGENPITRVVTDKSSLSDAELEAADMTYVTCANAELRASQGTPVGLLRAGKENGPQECSAAASGSSIGNLRVDKPAKPENVGFEVGASLCAVTPSGRIARATITKITFNAGIANIIPTIEFELTTWIKK